MHAIGKRNEDTPSLEPLYATARSAVSVSPGPGSASPSAIVNFNNDANNPEFNLIPGSPASIYSFDSFIEESYISTPKSLEINVHGIAEPYPRSYFSPDSAEFNEKWDEAIGSSYNPYTSRNASATSLGSGRSLSPSIRATAERVTFTPVRAVRRSMRQSFVSQLSAKFAPSYGDTTSGEKRNFGASTVWRPYTAMLKLLNRSNSYVVVDEPHHPSITEATPHVIYSPDLEKGLPVLPPLPFHHNQYLSSDEKHGSRTAGDYKCRKSRSTPALKSLGRRTNLVAHRDSDTNVCEEGDMDGIHDLTLEATEIATCLSAKWKFEPLPPVEESPKRRASL